MKWRRFVSLPILAVLILMEMVYYGTVFIFLDDWIGLQSSAGWTNAVIFTLLASFTLFSFFVCVLTDPGGVPSGYFPDIEINDGSDQESNKTEALKKRCDKCSAYKPPRAHHCRVCRRCVLKMDHHCTWINNCVGQRNHKAFFLLVVYATISSLHSLVITVGCGVQKDWEFAGMTRLKTFYITSGAMISLLSLTLGTLLGWHIYLLTHNMTTIEYYEGTRAAWLARKSGLIYKHPYDVGVYRNLTVVPSFSLFSPVFHMNVLVLEILPCGLYSVNVVVRCVQIFMHRIPSGHSDQNDKEQEGDCALGSLWVVFCA